MASLHEINDRIKSINDIMKITNAMYLISSSKVRKARKNLNDTYPFFDKSLETMSEILSNAGELNYRAFDKRSEIPDEDRKKAYIVMTGDKGLCGAYNHNIIKETEKMIASPGRDIIYVMGTIGRLYFQRRAKADEKVDLAEDFMYSYDNPHIFTARDIAEDMCERFYNKEIDELYIIYTRMTSFVDMEPGIIKCLPLDKSAFRDEAKESSKEIFADANFVPSAEVVMDRLVPTFLKGIIYCTMVEAFCAEQQARMSAMDNATTNSKDMLADLSLMYNRARQAAITQEITEVVSGAQLQS